MHIHCMIWYDFLGLLCQFIQRETIGSHFNTIVLTNDLSSDPNTPDKVFIDVDVFHRSVVNFRVCDWSLYID